MRVVVIGGTGHVGTYLIPRLVAAGHEVVNVSRQQRDPYLPHKAWQSVEQISLDRSAAETAGTFGQQIADLQPDIVIDMICFTLESCQQLVKALRGKVQHFLHCGTIWTHGHSTVVPATEDLPRRPFGDYGIQKAAIEAYLLKESRQNGFPATMLHPGHIVGPGYALINPAGNLNLNVFEKLAHGEEVLLPNLGLETLHHVHADDVAQGFIQAMLHWSASVGENFHIVSAGALTLRGYAEAVAAWFGKEANLKFVSWETFKSSVPENDANATWDHIAHSPNASIAKAQRLIGYAPRYTSLEATFESVSWLIENGKIQVKKAAVT